MQNKPMAQKKGLGAIVRDAAIVGLVPIVLAAGGCSKATKRGMRLTLAEIEYGSVTTNSDDPNTQSEVINSNPKYEETIRTSPARGYGIKYRGQE